jgi:hypothetical protein
MTERPAGTSTESGELTEPPPPISAPAPSLVRAVLRSILHLTAVLLLVVIRGRRFVLVGAAIVIVAWLALANATRLGVPAWMLPQFLQPGGGQPGGVRVTRIASLSTDAVPSVDAYIRGLTQFDASMMWGALAEEAITAMRARGGSLEALQAGLDDAKRRGARYEDVTMIGNYPLQDGRRYLFYVLSRRGFTGPDVLEQVYFIFTVNREGKITRIE